MRLFFAVDLPESIKKDLAPVVRSFRELGRGIRPVGFSSFHLTLLFLGEQPETAIDEFGRIGELATPSAAPCRLELGESGFFTRVSFLTLKGEMETLAVIKTVLNEACINYLEKPDDRPFKPHITLARHREKISPKIKNHISEHVSPFKELSWTVDEMVLYRSVLDPGGAIYTPLARFKFGGN